MAAGRQTSDLSSGSGQRSSGMGGRVEGMSLTFAGTLDHSAVTAAVDQFTDLVGSVEVAEAWAQESALPGMTVGGLVCHLVSQAECATEFVITPGPPDDVRAVAGLRTTDRRLPGGAADGDGGAHRRLGVQRRRSGPGVRTEGARARARPTRSAGRPPPGPRRGAARPESARALSRLRLGILTGGRERRTDAAPGSIRHEEPQMDARPGRISRG